MTTPGTVSASSALLSDVTPFPFPAPSRQATGLVSGAQTTVSAMDFADKLIVTISQAGRLSQWIQVPMTGPVPSGFDLSLLNHEDMLPLAHLTPRTLLGGGGDERETVGQLYATQIASFIYKRNPEETRTLLVGLGLMSIELAREAFFDMMELLQKVI